MTHYIAPEDDNGKRLLHKQGCKEMPPWYECRTTVQLADPAEALAAAKNQVGPSNADSVELCMVCWKLPGRN